MLQSRVRQAVSLGTYEASVRGKQIPLEALRGLAALVVVGWHVTLAFFPARAGILPDGPAGVAFNDRVWFGLLNGPAAVVFFFVLSGYVLTYRALVSGDSASLVRGMAKRWPRLAGPVLVTVVGAWGLIALGWTAYGPVASLTGSSWLLSSGDAAAPGTTLVPSLRDAVLEGAIRTFLFGDHSYDSPIWTMRLEFYGSFLVFGLALIMIRARALPPGVTAMGLLACTIVASLVQPTLIGFPVGLWWAWHTAAQPPRLSRRAALLCCLVGVWLAGWSLGHGADLWIARRAGLCIPPELAQAIGALLILMAAQGCPALAARLSGRAAAWLGRVSFPIYLVHVPILCSAGCASYLAAGRVLPGAWPAAIAIAVTLAVTLAVSVLLARFDAWWTGRLTVWFSPAGRLVPIRVGWAERASA